jgi:BirA family biotin operon repressor/biotin-[acetyl-CoA-carboxylase] ligase
LWITILARPATPAIPRVTTVRLGLAAARSLDRFAATRVQIKWPNDLFVDDRKLAGLLVEARWRGTSPEWLAIGIGINVTGAGHARRGGALESGTARAAVLRAVMPALQAAIDRADATLDDAEIAEYDARDLARGANCVEPVSGIVRGITRAAELIIDTAAGEVTIHSGSLVLAEEP